MFSSDAAGHLLSLDIDLDLNGANTTENNKSITARCHVSPRSFGAIIGESIHSSTRYSLFCETDKCKDELHAHMGLEGIQRASYRLCACVCVSVYLSVCKAGVRLAVGGEGAALYFSFLAYQPWRSSPVQ